MGIGFGADIGSSRAPSSRLVFLGSRDNAGDVIVVANPATRSCRAFGLPRYANGAVTGLALRKERYAYVYNPLPGRDRVLAGTVGRRFRAYDARGLTAGPVWAGSRVAWAVGTRIVFGGGGSITPKLAPGATITELAAHGRRFAPYAGKALYLVDGRTTKLETEPFPAGEAPGPVWSPDGSRLAILRNGDLWTIPAGRGSGVRVARGRSPSAPGGASLSSWVWSPDSRRLVYASFSGSPQRTKVYVQPATGGARRLVVHGRRFFPLAWRGDWLAVQTGDGIAVVSLRGGAMTPLCRRFWPVVRTGTSASWVGR